MYLNLFPFHLADLILVESFHPSLAGDDHQHIGKVRPFGLFLPSTLENAGALMPVYSFVRPHIPYREYRGGKGKELPAASPTVLKDAVCELTSTRRSASRRIEKSSSGVQDVELTVVGHEHTFPRMNTNTMK